MTKNKVNTEEGSVYIYVFLMVVLIYPLMMYLVMSYSQQSYIAKGVKQSMNRAITAAAMQVDVKHEYKEDDEGNEEHPVVRFKINEEKALDVLDKVLRANLNELGYKDEDYDYNLIIEGEIIGQFEWSIPKFNKRLVGEIIENYNKKGNRYKNQYIKADGPIAIVILEIKNKGFFKGDETKTFKVASSELVIPLRYEDILNTDSWKEGVGDG